MYINEIYRFVYHINWYRNVLLDNNRSLIDIDNMTILKSGLLYGTVHNPTKC